MRVPLEIPIVLRRMKIHGPAGVREIDVILDTGAVYTVIAWDVIKDIGYDPAGSERCIAIRTNPNSQWRTGRCGGPSTGRFLSRRQIAATGIDCGKT